MVNGTQMTLDEFSQETYLTQTVGASDSHARTSASAESKTDLEEAVHLCFSELCTLLDSSKKKRSLNGYSSRMLRTFLALTEDGISPDFSLSWTRQGTMQNGKFSTAKTSEYHRTEKGVSLSDILEAEVDEKYFLSEKATMRLLSYKDTKVYRS